MFTPKQELEKVLRRCWAVYNSTCCVYARYIKYLLSLHVFFVHRVDAKAHVLRAGNLFSIFQHSVLKVFVKICRVHDLFLNYGFRHFLYLWKRAFIQQLCFTLLTILDQKLFLSYKSIFCNLFFLSVYFYKQLENLTILYI